MKGNDINSEGFTAIKNGMKIEGVVCTTLANGYTITTY